MSDTRKLLSDAIDRWERWAAGEMFLVEHLHPRARARLLDDLEAIAPVVGGVFVRIVDTSTGGQKVSAAMNATFEGAATSTSKPKGKKAGA